MTITLNGTTGITDVDGTASAPALTGTDTDTGVFFPAANTLGLSTGGTERLRLDSSGNAGLGVTPSAWSTNYKVVEIGKVGSSIFTGTSSGNILNASNAYLNSSDAWTYRNNGYAAYSAVRNTDTSLFTWNIAASGTAGNAITFTQAMTLDASGNLGVGTTSPTNFGSGYRTLEVANSGVNDTFILATQTAGAIAQFRANSDGTIGIGSRSNGAVYFTVNNTERARIDSSGNLLVGTTSVPGAGSATTGIGLGSGAYLTVQRAAATPFFCGRSNDGEIMALYSGTTQRGTVSISGATTTYGSVSDYRLKENISPITGGLSKVMALKPSTFNFKEFPNQQVTGFIAHEVGEVEPIAVSGSKDAVDEDGKPIYQAVDPAKLVALLTAAIQELKAIVDEQAAEIAALKGNA